MPYPPATYYGPVLASPGFTPAAGMLVTARINGQACGQARTMVYNSQIVYAVNVWPMGRGAHRAAARRAAA